MTSTPPVAGGDSDISSLLPAGNAVAAERRATSHDAALGVMMEALSDDGSSVMSDGAEASDPSSSTGTADRKRSSHKRARRQSHPIETQPQQASPGGAIDAANRTAIAAYPMSLRKQLALVKQMEAPPQTTVHSSSSSSAAGTSYDPSKSPGGSGAASPLGGGGSGKKRLARVHRRNDRGETPLHVAARKGEHAQCRRLLAEGARVDDADNAGWTALHEACQKGRVRVARVLIDGGANVNARSLDDETPLHDAASNGDEKLVWLLLFHGADRTKANKEGKTPLDCCPTSADAVCTLLRATQPPTMPPPESPPGSPESGHLMLASTSTDVNCPISIAISSPISSTATTADPSPCTMFATGDSPNERGESDADPSPSESAVDGNVQGAISGGENAMDVTITDGGEMQQMQEGEQEGKGKENLMDETAVIHEQVVVKMEEMDEGTSMEETRRDHEEPQMGLAIVEEVKEESEMRNEQEKGNRVKMEEEDEAENGDRGERELKYQVGNTVEKIEPQDTSMKSELSSESRCFERSSSEAPPDRRRHSAIWKATAVASDGDEKDEIGAPPRKRSLIATCETEASTGSSRPRASKAASASVTPRRRGRQKAPRLASPAAPATTDQLQSQDVGSAANASTTAADVYEFHSSSESDQLVTGLSQKDRRFDDEKRGSPNRIRDDNDEMSSSEDDEDDEEDEKMEVDVNPRGDAEEPGDEEQPTTTGTAMPIPPRKVPPLRISLTKTPSEEEATTTDAADTTERARSASVAARPARAVATRRKNNSSEDGSTNDGGREGGKASLELRMTRSKVKQQGGSAHLDGHGSQTAKRGKGGWRRPTMTQQRFNNNANNETTPGLIEGTGRDTNEIPDRFGSSLQPGGPSDRDTLPSCGTVGGVSHRLAPPASGTRPSQSSASSLMYKNPYEAYRGIRQLIEQRWVKSMRENSANQCCPPPENYANYLINTKKYRLGATLQVEDPPHVVRCMSEPLRVLHAEQERRRERVRCEHRTQAERLQLFVEKEYLRSRNREANQGTGSGEPPMTAVRVIRDAEIYTPLSLERPQRRLPSTRSSDAAELHAELIAKFERQVQILANRQRMEVDALYAEQSREWQSVMKRMQISDSYVKNENDQMQVPRVTVTELKLNL